MALDNFRQRALASVHVHVTKSERLNSASTSWKIVLFSP